MVFTLYGDTSDANVDMLALRTLRTKLKNPNLKLQDASTLTTQAMYRTGIARLQTRQTFTNRSRTLHYRDYDGAHPGAPAGKSRVIYQAAKEDASV